jgi:hypothetical protein
MSGGLQPLPTDPKVVKETGEWTPTYQGWVAGVQRWLSPIGQFGTTAQRPTRSLYIGQRYYDTTLGYPVWVHQVSPSIIWHNGAGAAV